MSITSPWQVADVNRQLALMNSANTRSAFNWNYIADQFNMTQIDNPVNIEDFVRDQATKAYHNNDFDPALDEANYPGYSTSLAPYMINERMYGTNVSQNRDLEAINAPIFSYDDEFVTGRPGTTQYSEDPRVINEKGLDEMRARMRYIMPLVVPSKPTRETVNPSYDWRYTDPEKYRELQTDDENRFKAMLQYKDGSILDSYDVGAPTSIYYSAADYKSQELNEGDLITNVQNQEMQDGTPGGTMLRPRRIDPYGLINIDDPYVDEPISAKNRRPTGAQQYDYSLNSFNDGYNDVPVRAMALLRVLVDGDDFNIEEYDDVKTMTGRMQTLYNRYFKDRPDVDTDMDYNEAFELFNKQVSMDPAERLDPLATIQVLEDEQNGISRAIAARKRTRLVEYRHTVDMSEQQEVAMQTYGTPGRSRNVRSYKGTQAKDDVVPFSDVRRILFRKPRGAPEPVNLGAYDEQEINNLKAQQMHVANIPDMQTTIRQNRLDSTNGPTGGSSPYTPATVLNSSATKVDPTILSM
jgi:hypothetical protein